MQPRVLLVDGHSAIFQSKELSTLQRRKKSSVARNRLIHLLTRYADTTGTHVVLVFDGQGPQLSQEFEGIQIFYSKKNQTADAIIERLVAKYATIYDVRVATDDSLERQTIVSFGANWISILQLFSEIQAAEEDLERRIKALRDWRLPKL